MSKPNVGIVIRKSLRERILSDWDLQTLESFADVTINDEGALIAELQTGRFTAFLDVTDPEPPAMDSPLRRLPNVVLTPHCAGLQSHRIGALKVEELRRFFAGEAQVFQVKREMLDRLA